MRAKVKDKIMNTLINNISFSLSDSIEFSFQHGNGDWDQAYLQLPDTGDSVHSILGEDFDADNEEHKAIFEQLTAFYFDSFKDVECAAASALLQKEILHVEEIDGLYVAFSENEAHIIVECAYRSYYNKQALFAEFQWDREDNPNETELVKAATAAYFASLTRELTSELNTEVKSAKENSTGDDLNIWNQGFDNCVHEFMKAEFDQFDIDYNHNELAQEFYQMHACDCRCDAENELREHFDS